MYLAGDSSVLVNLSDPIWRQYVPWTEGREVQTDSSGLRSEFQTSSQQGLPTSWWATGCEQTVSSTTYPCNSATMPPENPAVVQIDTELLDTSQKVFSRRTLAYDHFSNVTDTTDYDYASVPTTGTVAAAVAGQALKVTRRSKIL
jgi:hypothetical protein